MVIVTHKFVCFDLYYLYHERTKPAYH